MSDTDDPVEWFRTELEATLRVQYKDMLDEGDPEIETDFQCALDLSVQTFKRTLEHFQPPDPLIHWEVGRVVRTRKDGDVLETGSKTAEHCGVDGKMAQYPAGTRGRIEQIVDQREHDDDDPDHVAVLVRIEDDGETWYYDWRDLELVEEGEE